MHGDNQEGVPFQISLMDGILCAQVYGVLLIRQVRQVAGLRLLAWPLPRRLRPAADPRLTCSRRIGDIPRAIVSPTLPLCSPSTEIPLSNAVLLATG